MNIFLDSGILLDFYRISSNEAELYKKIIALVENNAVSIYLTEQVKHEFSRMKEDIIQAALDEFLSLNVPLNTPPIFNLDEEYTDFKEKARVCNTALKKLHAKFSEQFKNNELEADSLIDTLFDQAKYHETTPELLQKAKVRMAIRNPPGKIDELGDRLNWETLLAWEDTNNIFSDKKDNNFYIISKDGDYFRKGPKKTKEIKLFLQNEWAEIKENNIYGFESLKDFFIEKFPTEKLATDLELEILVRQLEDSGCFEKTHKIIEKLSRIQSLSDSHVNRIIEAYINNNQIYWIIDDPDVAEYLDFLLENFPESISDSSMEQIALLRDDS